ncbi:hypothetical protein Q7P37_001690 [Cladosporium fusiforme]
MLSLPTLALLGAVTLTVGYYIYRAALPKPIPGIPYNESAVNRILGDAQDAISYQKKTGDIMAWVTDQVLKHDQPVIQLFMRPFGKPWVVITDFREMQDIVNRRTREFDRSNFFGDLFYSILQNHHVHMPTSDRWRAHRKLMGDTMTPAFLNNVVGPQMHRNALSMIELWREKARLARGHPFAAKDDIKAAAMDIIWAAAFGTQMKVADTQTSLLSGLSSIDLPADPEKEATLPSAPNPEAFDAVLTVSDTVEIALQSLFPRIQHSLALMVVPRYRKAVALKDRLIGESLDIAWKKFSVSADNDEAVKCAADLVVQREAQMARKERRPAQWDTAEVRDELFGFLVAGHDTSSTSLCWTLKRLTSHQEVQEKLRAALQAAFPRAHAAGELPTSQEICNTRVPYLDAVIEETHRKNGAASSVIRVTTTDTDVLGHRVPKGTDVFMLTTGPDFKLRSIPVDEKVRSTSSRDSKDKNGAWDPDTIESFLPERWLETDEQGNVSFNPRAGPAMPFGGGPRGCFGRKMAELELRTLVALLVLSFKFAPTPEELSGYAAHDVITHLPWQCYVKLTALK